MPEMNGYMATEHIRKNLQEPQKHIPILAMTAHATSSEKEKCLAAGMNDYVSKPFDPIEVKNKIIELSGKLNSIEPVKSNQSDQNSSESRCSVQKLTNLTFLNEMSGGNAEFIREFLTLFLNNIPLSVNELEEGLKARDYEKIRTSAHKMKPSLNYVGLKDTYETVANLEKYAKEQIHLEDFPEMITKISDACAIACIELENDLKHVEA